ncbi:MAG TPA: corrinoid protein [Methanosarcina sp.]|nr:corrinoid protein [Methanosarcina sp.]
MDDLPEEVQELIEELDKAAEDEEEDKIKELTQKLLATGIDVGAITLKKLSLLVMDGEEEMTRGWTEVAIQIGMDPFKTLIEGLAAGMSLIGKKYENGEAFVPQLLIASTAMYGGMDLLAPYMKQSENITSKPATVVIGTVEGDVHDIGKNLVKTLLSANGFNCVDLGNDVPASKFVEAAKEYRATAVSMSTLMTTTMAEMPRVVKMLIDEGIRDNVMVMVGGAPITTGYAAQIGADASPRDAASAASWLKEAIFDFPSENVRWG